jgi:hypothetical protein
MHRATSTEKWGLVLALDFPHCRAEVRAAGDDGSLRAGPSWDERLTVEDSVEIPVQVNGKTRSKISVVASPKGGCGDVAVY